MKSAWLIGGLLIAGTSPRSAMATSPQTPVVAANRSASAVDRDATVLNREVSVQLSNVPLKRALQAIASNAKVHIEYQVELVDAVEKPVSVMATRSPLGKVLEQALLGTTLRPIVTASDAIALQPSAHSPSLLQGVIIGKVVHARTKQPVANARVVLDDHTEGVTTNGQGEFRIAVATGEHTIHVRSVGMHRYSKRVQVKEGETIRLDVVLDASASVLDEVVVTGTVVETERRAIATPITVITADEIEKRAITRIDQLFRGEVPGLWVADQGALAYSPGNSIFGLQTGSMEKVTMYARGAGDLAGGANPIKTYIDGVELVDPTLLGTIDPQSIDRIEIIVGPQAATIYGSGAMGGVMQIFTKKGNNSGLTEVRANLRYGILQSNLSDGLTPSHNHAVTLSGGNGPGFTFTGTLSYSSTGQWQPGLYARRQGASFGGTFTAGQLRLSASMSGQGTQNGSPDTRGIYGTPYWNQWIKSGLYYSALGAATTANPNLTDGAQVKRVSRTTAYTYAVDGDYKINAFWRHQGNLGRNQTWMELDPKAPRYSNVPDSLFEFMSRDAFRTTIGYSTTLQSPRSWTVTQDLTIGYNQSSARELRTLGCANTKDASQLSSCMPDGEAARPRSESEAGGFATARIGFWSRLFISGGVRLQKNQNYGRAHKIDVTPTNGITYSFNLGDATIKIMGSYGKATRPPAPGRRDEVWTLTPLFDPISYITQFANPDLTPEYSRGPQGGIEVYYGNIGSLMINHYSQRIDDLMQPLKVDSIHQFLVPYNFYSWMRQVQWQNVASLEQFGWEATATANIRSISLKGTWSWSDSRITKVAPLATQTYTVGQSFMNLPTHTGNITIGYARGPVSLQLVTNFSGSRPISLTAVPVYWETGHFDLRLREYIGRRNAWPENFSRQGYAKSDLTTFYRLNDRMSLTLNVTNVGNSYNNDASLPTPSLGRQTLFGLSIRPSLR